MEFVFLRYDYCALLCFTDSQEENYRAFKLFSIMDTDNSGSITLAEINRLLMGDIYNSFTVDFDHPDTGIKWGLDCDNCVSVLDVEAHSPSSEVFTLFSYQQA